MPQYGGTITASQSINFSNFDTYNGTAGNSLDFAWFEQLFTDDWTLNPSVYNYQISFRPPDYAAGNLVQSWEFSPTDINTYIVSLRQNVYFQNIAPVNGRQLTSADVVYSFDRNLGLGDGFTTISSYWASDPHASIKSVTATDKYTVSFTWANTNPESIAETMQQATLANMVIPSELVTTYGNLNNWRNQVGSGPFILTDWVDSTAMTLTANPNYWGTDERYPQNKLPYIKLMNYLIIPSAPTALAAMRAGKIDFDNSGLTVQSVTAMQQTNPNISVIQTEGAVLDILPKDSIAPFNNLNVRIAMQQALNLPLIASTYYQGTANPMPQTLTSYYISGWGWPYPQWPASLQAEYAYNPTNAKALLAAAGYPNGFSTTLTADSTNDMALLNIVQSEEAAIGVNITLQPMLTAAITPFMQSSQWTGLSQRTTGLIGRILAPLRVLPEFIPGNSVNFEGWNDPVYTAIYNNAMSASTIDQVKLYDQQANQYVAQQHILICLVTPTQYALCQPWLIGYNGQNFAFSNLIQTYGARFWIDQSKK
jgi:peptide/nickel transport system substrate-binding protein